MMNEKLSSIDPHDRSERAGFLFAVFEVSILGKNQTLLVSYTPLAHCGLPAFACFAKLPCLAIKSLTHLGLL